MGPYVSGLIAFFALLFTWYQWRRNTGRVRLDIADVQDGLYVRVTVDAPSDITVDSFVLLINYGTLKALGYAIHDMVRKGGGGFVKRLWLAKVSFGLFAWIRLDTVEHEDDVLTLPGGWTYKLVGPSLPCEIMKYRGVTWEMRGRHIKKDFRDARGFVAVYDLFDNALKKGALKLRFVASVSGHPTRKVKSKWKNLSRLAMIQSENSGLRKFAQPKRKAEDKPENRDGYL